MSRSVFIASPEGLSGKSSVAYGLLDLLSHRVGRVGVFRPVTESLETVDPVVHLLLSHPAVEQPYDSTIGVSYHALHADFDAALSKIVDRFGGLTARYDAVVVVGSDYTDVMTGNEWYSNATIAANLGSPVVLVVHGRDRTPEHIASTVELACSELISEHAQPVAVVANRVNPDDVDAVRVLLSKTGLPVGAIPEIPLLIAPTVADLQRACGAQLVRGNPEWLQRESMGLLVAAMSLPNVLTRLQEDYTVIAPGDRSDLLPALILAHQSGTFPHLSAILLTGGYLPPEPVADLIDGVQQDLPILITPNGTFETASVLSRVHGTLNAASRVKLETALRVFADSAPTADRANYLRFRLSPNAAVALAARVKHPGKEFVGDQRELYLLEELAGAESPYERLLSDAMMGNGALFTREDAVEAAWAAVDPVLRNHPPALPYKRGTWGPPEADALIAPHGRWHNPAPDWTTT